MVREALTPERLATLEPGDAAAYFVVRRAEGLTDGEQQLLAGWLAGNEAHRRAFSGAERSWKCFADSDGDEILAAMRAHALAQHPKAAAAWRPALAAAAVLVLAVGALVLFPTLNPWAPGVQPTGGVTLTALQFESARGEVKELQLPDGSSMTLDADSHAVGRFDGEHRSVELQRGRAYFAIRADRAHPFVARAAGRNIVVVGTRFDVNLTADGLTITLLEGHVEVSSADPARAPVMLQPGQQYVERGGQATIRTIGAAGENAISWRGGLVSFSDQTLAEAVAIMNRYSNQQLVIEDPRVATLRVSGQFRAGDPGRFADTLAELHPLRVTRRGDRVEISSR